MSVVSLRVAFSLTLFSVAAGGCTSAAPPTPSKDVASIVAASDAFIDEIDGQRLKRSSSNETETLTPGAHVIVLRRRAEGQGGYNKQPDGYPLIVGRDRGNRGVFVTDTICTVDLTAVAGAQYTVRTNDGRRGAWTGTVSGGPRGDAGCVAVTHIPHALLAESRFLCCTMAFQGGKATDANYRYEGWRTERLVAGTPVHIRETGQAERAALVMSADGVHLCPRISHTAWRRRQPVRYYAIMVGNDV